MHLRIDVPVKAGGNVVLLAGLRAGGDHEYLDRLRENREQARDQNNCFKLRSSS
jgi:hypothetical protein